MPPTELDSPRPGHIDAPAITAVVTRATVHTIAALHRQRLLPRPSCAPLAWRHVRCLCTRPRTANVRFARRWRAKPPSSRPNVLLPANCGPDSGNFRAISKEVVREVEPTFMMSLALEGPSIVETKGVLVNWRGSFLKGPPDINNPRMHSDRVKVWGNAH